MARLLRTAAKIGVAKSIANSAVDRGQRANDTRAEQKPVQQSTEKTAEEKLISLKSMLDKELISQAEYDEKKQVILKEM